VSGATQGLARLGLGTVALGLPYGIGGERVPHDAAAALLRDAIAAGIRYVDTAAAYGDAETVVGRVARELREAGVRVCTKITVSALRATGAIAGLRESLARLGLERVDTVMLHSADAGALRDEHTNAGLAQLVESGITARIGVSTYGATDATLAHSFQWVRALQVEHSILNPSVVRALNGEQGDANPRVEVVARSVLCKGLLTARRAQAGAVATGLAGTLDALETFARERGLELPELAFRYALDSPGVDVVLVGVSNAAELTTALRAAARTPLTAAELRMLDSYDRSTDDASHPELWKAS